VMMVLVLNFVEVFLIDIGIIYEYSHSR